MGKFAEPTGLTGDWIHTHTIHFWHAQGPWAIKHAIEKITATRLTRDLTDAETLSYVGSSGPSSQTRTLRLRFEAVVGARMLYSLAIESRASRNWNTEESFLRDAQRAIEYWSGQLQLASGLVTSDSPERFHEEIQRGMADETRIVPEDPAAITALQREVLAGLRAGKYFGTSHKEGSSRLSFNGRAFLRVDEGEDSKRETYRTDEEMLEVVRKFYDWESRRGDFPHRPPELDVWKYILGQLRAK